MENEKIILETNITEDKDFAKQQNDKYGINVCPECGGALIKQAGCKRCIDCNYEACEL